ncbi:hypothetical protein GBAR_LOCUS51 [Geodia barretti]|uniref:Uncharacterized protein n=1 Tax=Geodia barretti TaxID=519541 RepID=A0AA35QRA0_GEOBA|nr:hypothetical protein GBAR_LOCUS51 [Geodia barretti]
MASRRKSKRRLEELQEPQGDVRRSPRLRERYSRERSEGPALLTVTQSVTSRPALSGYMKELEQQNASILNESGQSVPAYFDLGQDDTGSRHSGDSREEIDAVSGQPFGTPDPQHLYGLDESEDEDFESQTRSVSPPPATPSREGDRRGVLGMVVGGVVSVLFKLGSLLYLTATAVLCLDVIILHRCYMVFTAVTCWSTHAASRPWLRFWVLPVVLISLIAAMIGGGLVPTTADSPQFNITGADLDRLRSEIAASIRSTLSKDVHHHVAEHVDKVVKEWVESRLTEERNASQEGLQQLRTESDQKGIELSRVLSEVESQETRLVEMWNQSQSTFITEAIALQMVQLHIQQQLNSAKQEWLKLVPQEMSSVTESVDSLRKELSARDNQLSKKLLALERLVEDNNTTATESLLQLILELQTASASISDLTKGADSQTSQLASIKSEVARLKSVEEEERKEVVERLESLEGARLGREDLATAFQEEMEKSVGSDTSVLWLWLSQELEKAGEERAVSTSGLTRKVWAQCHVTGGYIIWLYVYTCRRWSSSSGLHWPHTVPTVLPSLTILWRTLAVWW